MAMTSQSSGPGSLSVGLASKSMPFNVPPDGVEFLLPGRLGLGLIPSGAGEPLVSRSDRLPGAVSYRILGQAPRMEPG